MIVAFFDYFTDIEIQAQFFGRSLPAQATTFVDKAVSASRKGLPCLIKQEGSTHTGIIAEVQDAQYASLQKFYELLGYTAVQITLNNLQCIMFNFTNSSIEHGRLMKKDEFSTLVALYNTGAIADLKQYAHISADESTVRLKRALQRHNKEQDGRNKATIIAIAVAFALSLAAIILFLVNLWSQSANRLNDRIIDEATASTKWVSTDESSQSSVLTSTPINIPDITTSDTQPSSNEDTTTEAVVEPTFLELDWSTLKKKYPNLVGWLYIPGVEISYPVAQGYDNEFYLNHLIDGKPGLSGWLFADYQLSNDYPVSNYVIYGHNMADGTMFGHLKHVTWDDWWSNPSNQYIYYATESYTAIYQVFNAMTVKSTEVYYHNVTIDNNTVLNYIKEMTAYNQMRNHLTYSGEFTSDSKIITLSTCNDSEGAWKFVLQGVMIAVK